MDNKDLLRLLDEFLNENGQWFNFLDHVEKEGYDPDEAESILINLNN